MRMSVLNWCWLPPPGIFIPVRVDESLADGKALFFLNCAFWVHLWPAKGQNIGVDGANRSLLKHGLKPTLFTEPVVSFSGRRLPDKAWGLESGQAKSAEVSGLMPEAKLTFLSSFLSQRKLIAGSFLVMFALKNHFPDLNSSEPWLADGQPFWGKEPFGCEVDRSVICQLPRRRRNRLAPLT